MSQADPNSIDNPVLLSTASSQISVLALVFSPPRHDDVNDHRLCHLTWPCQPTVKLIPQLKRPIEPVPNLYVPTFLKVQAVTKRSWVPGSDADFPGVPPLFKISLFIAKYDLWKSLFDLRTVKSKTVCYKDFLTGRLFNNTL